VKDPVSQHDIAHRLRVSEELVRSWRARSLLPRTDRLVAGRPVWEWAVIKKWWDDREATPRRGPAIKVRPVAK
jgi:hypothetical protein